MKIISYLNSFIIPAMVLAIILFGIYKKTDVFSAFTEGAKEGLETAVDILPSLIGLIFAVKLFRASNIAETAEVLWKPFEKITGFPSQLVPLIFCKMFSSSAATGIVLDIFENYGTDTYIGRLASIMMCCTETVFYTLSIYFSPAGIKKTGYIIKCTLFGILCGTAASVILAAGMAT